MKNDNLIHKNNTWVLNNNKQNNGVTKKKSRIEYLALLGKEKDFNKENNSQNDEEIEPTDMYIYTNYGVEKVSINTSSNDKKNEANKSNRYQYLKEKINNAVKHQEKLKNEQIEEQNNSINHEENNVNDIFVFDRNKNEINIINTNDISKTNNKNEIDDGISIALDNCKNISEICTSQNVFFQSCDNKNEESGHSNKSKMNIFYDTSSEKNNHIDKRIEEVFQSEKIISKTIANHKNKLKTNNISVNNQDNKEPIEVVSIKNKENNIMPIGKGNESFKEDYPNNNCNNSDKYYDSDSKSRQSYNCENNFNVHKEINSLSNKMQNLNKLIEEINNKKHVKINILNNKISSLDIRMYENQTNNINNEINILNSKIYNLYNEKINKIYEQITQNIHELNNQIIKVIKNGEYNEIIKSFNSKIHNQTDNIKMQIRHLQDQVDNYLLMQKSGNLFNKINDCINNLNNQIESSVLKNEFLRHKRNVNKTFNDNNNETKGIINVEVHNYRDRQNTDVSNKKNKFMNNCNDIQYDHKKKRKVNESNHISDDDNNGKQSLSIEKCINKYNHIENTNNVYNNHTIQNTDAVYSDKNENNDYNKLYNDEKFLYLKNKLIELKKSKMEQKLLSNKNSVDKRENMNIAETKDTLDYTNNANKNECTVQLRNNKQFNYINIDNNFKPITSQNEGNDNRISSHKSSSTSNTYKSEKDDLNCGVQRSQNISIQPPCENCHNYYEYNKKHKDIQNNNIYNCAPNNEKKSHDIVSMFKKMLLNSNKHKTHEIEVDIPDETYELNNLFPPKTEVNNLSNLQQNYNFLTNKNPNGNTIPPQLNTSNDFEKSCDSTHNWGRGHVIPTIFTTSNNNNGNSIDYSKYTSVPNIFTMDQMYKYTANYYNDTNKKYKWNDDHVVLEETNKEKHDDLDLNSNKEINKNNLKQKHNILNFEQVP
ncbi:conserved Plasmodium protein, unknown function [Plasmodium vinckei vinckei]|uniref:Uncharacterized protein n=1 Tax=Plasmodium vinckei vinckei TaxID=54757 RepID=A0A449BU87_PLAVN|nr:conserved Plasmodium protein, unknown function [Plasmodium vinckei vinckei]KEG03230.1 hypothetical protein YYE_02164 [Plasmodium vinckei vinckei]VEV57037.1 conserved Plasmodium protein, unknown function [Plasmodium vinckei vinckei]